MAGHVQVVRCKQCKRRYYASEDNCPGCGRKSSKGRLRTVFVVLCFVLAITAAVKLAIFMVSQTSKLDRLPEATGGN